MKTKSEGYAVKELQFTTNYNHLPQHADRLTTFQVVVPQELKLSASTNYF